MRIIDKYLLREFGLPWLYCFDAFAMLYIVQDLLDNLSDFIQYRAPASQILRYYLIVLPDALVLILPMSLLLAVLFCLSSLGKHNELVALRASGLGVGRLAVPFLAVGIAASVLVFVLNENFVPRAKEKADAFLSELRGKGPRTAINNFFFANTTDRRDWFARRFDTRAKTLETVEIHQRDADGKPLLDVFAESAVWTNGMWRFRQADIYDYSRGQLAVTRVAETNFPAFTEPPKRLALEGRKPDQMSMSELRRHIATLQASRRTSQVADYQVTLHYRFAFPLTCLIVVWIGIPLGMRVSRQGPLLGIGMALVLVVAFYFLTHITLALGKGERVPPVVAAWLTNAIFAGIGAELFRRSR